MKQMKQWMIAAILICGINVFTACTSNEDKLVEALKTDRYDWIVVNFANADMVGHTGVYTAIEQAVKTIDQCLISE